jgi:hypothetical protein
MGIGGTIVCLLAMPAFESPMNALFAAVGMCINSWGAAAWMLSRSDHLARRIDPIAWIT